MLACLALRDEVESSRFPAARAQIAKMPEAPSEVSATHAFKATLH